MDYLWSEIGRTIGGAEPPRDHCVFKQYTVPNLRQGSVLFLLVSQGADAKLRDNSVAQNLTRKFSSNFFLCPVTEVRVVKISVESNKKMREGCDIK
jgi:hypothetical protein